MSQIKTKCKGSVWNLNVVFLLIEEIGKPVISHIFSLLAYRYWKGSVAVVFLLRSLDSLSFSNSLVLRLRSEISTAPVRPSGVVEIIKAVENSYGISSVGLMNTLRIRVIK